MLAGDLQQPPCHSTTQRKPSKARPRTGDETQTVRPRCLAQNVRRPSWREAGFGGGSRAPGSATEPQVHRCNGSRAAASLSQAPDEPQTSVAVTIGAEAPM